ncbi:13155_t:CDS:2 [Funneliformis mosseae]|uniref:13155_t:CDS:1 n=1 Tax=Funneliformis mosseae TaxID=27381 RepID=A0A9N9CA04_FUNMO|nr:13155_t:CDS:2 [Funneliformis mosseae]
MSTTTAPSGGKRPTPGSADTPIRDKRLKTIACDRCRRRKVKCDGDGYNQTPCKYCVSVKLECTYGQKSGRTSGVSNQSNQSSPSKAITTPSKQTSRNPTRSKLTSTMTNNIDIVPVAPSISVAPTSRQRKAGSNQNIKPNTKRSTTSTNANRQQRIIPQVLPAMGAKGNEFEYAVKLFASVTLQNENQVRQQLGPYVQTSQVEKSSPNPQTSLALLEDTQLIEHLVDLYFKNCHPLLPVLHKAYFMRRFQDKSKSMSPLLLYAVCAIGSSYSNNPAARKDRDNPHTVGLAFYEGAQEMVNHYFDSPRLSTATALFLLGIFDALRSLKSHIYVGMATTLAITMRLHDKNAFSETLSNHESEARKRLWWGISIANHLQCISLNRMLAFEDKHCTIEHPNQTMGDDDTECKIIVYFGHYLTITKIMYDILEITLSDNEVDFDILQERLDTWKRELPSFLKIEEAKKLDNSYSETTIEHLRIYLFILYNYAIIRIHHPNILSPLSLAACTHAANNITSYVNEHFVYMINSEQFIAHCALYAGFIHVYNLRDPQLAKESKLNIRATIKLFKNVLNIPSLYYIHNNIKNLISIFESQLEGASDVDEHIINNTKVALTLVSGSNGSNSSTTGSPVSSTTSTEELRNTNNNNNVSNTEQDHSPKNSGFQRFRLNQPPVQNSSPGINSLARTAATRSPQYSPVSPINHGIGLQTQQMSQPQQTQSIFTTSPSPLSSIDLPPVTAKHESNNPSLNSEMNYSSTQYIHQHSNQTRQHENTSNIPSTWGSTYNYQWQPTNLLQPIQTQPHPNVQQQTNISPIGNESQTMMAMNNNSVPTSPSLNINRTVAMTSPNSSLPPLLPATANTNTAVTSSQIQFPYPSMSFSQFSTSQQQQLQHSSQPRQYYLASNSTSPPSTIGNGGNFVSGNEMSTELAPLMVNNGGANTNGVMSTSENSVSMLIESQNHGETQSGELESEIAMLLFTGVQGKVLSPIKV